MICLLLALEMTVRGNATLMLPTPQKRLLFGLLYPTKEWPSFLVMALFPADRSVLRVYEKGTWQITDGTEGIFLVLLPCALGSQW